PGKGQDQTRRSFGADLMAHRVRADRWILMGREVIAEAIARCCQWMRADEPLDRRQPDPIPADHGRRYGLRSVRRRRRLSLPWERPHWLRLLLFREAPIDAGNLLDDALADRML